MNIMLKAAPITPFKLLIAALAAVNLIGCAQRLERQPLMGLESPRETRFSERTALQVTTSKAQPGVIVNPEQGAPMQPAKFETKTAPEATADSQFPIENQAAAPRVRAAPEPYAPVLSIPGVPANDTPVACSVEFNAIEEAAGGEVMKRLAGFWIDDGTTTVRSVQNASTESVSERPAISLGAKNDEVYVAKVTFKPAEKFTPRTSPYVVSSIVRKGQAFSYLVGPEVNGFRLVQISLIGEKNSKMSCLTFGFKRDAAAADTLLVAGPLKNAEALNSDGQVKLRTYKRHTPKSEN